MCLCHRIGGWNRPHNEYLSSRSYIGNSSMVTHFLLISKSFKLIKRSSLSLSKVRNFLSIDNEIWTNSELWCLFIINFFVEFNFFVTSVNSFKKVFQFNNFSLVLSVTWAARGFEAVELCEIRDRGFECTLFFLLKRWICWMLIGNITKL